MKTFSPLALHDELEIVAQSFFDQEANFKLEDSGDSGSIRIFLSKILSWYISDFGGNIEQLFVTISPWLGAGPRERIENIIKEGRSGEIKVKYYPYDWGNDAKRSRRFDTRCTIQ